MATVVVTSSITWGDVFPYVALARGLVRAGHKVRFVVPGGFHSVLRDQRFDVMHAGFELSPVELLGDHDIDPDRWGGIHQGRLIYQRYVVPYLEKAYAALMAAADDCDLVVGQQTMPLARMVAEKAGKRWVSLALSPIGIPTAARFDGVWLSRLLPAGVEGRLISGMYRGLDLFWKWWLCNPPINSFRRSLGLPKLTVSPPVAGISPYLTISPHSQHFFERPADWPSSVVMTGPLHFELPATGDFQEIDDFLSAGPPPVAITLGTGRTARIAELLSEIERILEARGLRGLFLMNKDVLRNRSTHDRFGWFPHAPLRAVLSRCRAVVHKGGYGTTSAALLAGCPMVIVGRQLEHRFYARRVEALGVGRRCPWRPGAVGALDAAIAAVLEPGYAERARELAERIRRDDPVRRAVQEVERLL